MQDSDIREVLHSYLDKENKKYTDTIIVDELDLCSGLSRIDVAVINGFIHGYEIKSEEDNLNRLPNQIKYYNKSLEKVSVALNPIHLDKVLADIPDWWGVLIVNNNNKKGKLKEFRKAAQNPQVESQSILQLLWKEELISIINKYNLISKKNSNKNMLRENISQSLDIAIVSHEVRESLKSRKNWRS